MGAPVAFQGATMAGFGGAAATSGATLFSSAMLPSMFTGSFISPLLTNSAGVGTGLFSSFTGGGGLLSQIGTAADALNKYSGLISGGMSIMQGVGAYNRGKILEAQYDIQSEQVRNEQEIKRLNLIKDANDKARALLAANGSAFAYGYAGGVNAFDGSVALVTKKNEERYLRDLSTLEFNQQASENFQVAEMSLLQQAGDISNLGSKIDALGYIGSGFKMLEQTRVPTA